MRGKNVFCTSDEHFSAGDESIKNALKLEPHTATHVAPSDFEIELLSRLLLIGTVLTFENGRYPCFHTHLQVRYTHTLYTQ